MDYPVTEPFVHGMGSLTEEVATTECEAMCWWAGKLGRKLLALPHGEVRRPKVWMVPDIVAVKRLPGFVVDGDDEIHKYEDVQRVARFVGPGDMVIPTSVLSFVGEAERAYAALRQVSRRHPVVAERTLPILVGVGHTIDLLAFSMGDEALENEAYRRAFTAAVVRGAHDAYRSCHGRVVFQIESPKSLTMVQAAGSTKERQRRAAFLARAVADIVRQLPRGAEVITHLCRGDFNHQAWPLDWSDLRPMVVLANAIQKELPGMRTVLPMASGNITPPLEESHYAPLRQLDRKGRFIAGIVHEGVEIGHNREALTKSAKQLGRPFSATSTFCGLGRVDAVGATTAADQLDEITS